MALEQIQSSSAKKIEIQLFKDQILGIGSYGKVCRARYGSLSCAAKLFHETLFDPEAFKLIEREKKHRLPFKRFEQECEVLHNLRHPNVILYLDVYQDPDTKLPVLLMELMDGSLTHFLEDSLQQIPLHIQVNFSHDIALALSFLHANKITHRDLSSNNVLLISNIRAKVTDFGMATLRVSEQVTEFSRTMCPGTDVYMPPEAVEDKPVYTEKIDCFSLGVLIIQILAQVFPDPGKRHEEIELHHSGLPKGRKVKMTVPEVERRKNHIDMINPNHPLLAVALDCLNDLESDRPSAQQIYESIAALKESAEYTKSYSGTGEEITQCEMLKSDKSLMHILREKEELIEAKEKENQHLNKLIQLKDETIVDQKKEIEELMQQLSGTMEIIQQQEKQPSWSEKSLLYVSCMIAEMISITFSFDIIAESETENSDYVTTEDLRQQVCYSSKVKLAIVE
jgi:serine/threonine protein kinase